MQHFDNTAFPTNQDAPNTQPERFTKSPSRSSDSTADTPSPIPFGDYQAHLTSTSHLHYASATQQRGESPPTTSNVPSGNQTQPSATPPTIQDHQTTNQPPTPPLNPPLSSPRTTHPDLKLKPHQLDNTHFNFTDPKRNHIANLTSTPSPKWTLRECLLAPSFPEKLLSAYDLFPDEVSELQIGEPILAEGPEDRMKYLKLKGIDILNAEERLLGALQDSQESKPWMEGRPDERWIIHVRVKVFEDEQVD